MLFLNKAQVDTNFIRLKWQPTKFDIIFHLQLDWGKFTIEDVTLSIAFFSEMWTYDRKENPFHI